jgi:hypothetical protein
METKKNEPAICCPEFKPEIWDNKFFEWENKNFIKDKVCTFFYMPCNFGNAMRRLDKKMTNSGASSPDWLCLSEHSSMWNMNLLLATDKEIDDTENIKISGKMFSKVYEGHFKDTGKWMKDFKNTIQTKGIKAEKMFMWYTTCPKCAKKYGKNFVVIFAKVE